MTNGTIGRILEIVEEDGRFVIIVDFDAYTGPSMIGEHPRAIPVIAYQAGRKVQIPLSLSWAMTVHKAQGLTLPKVTVDLGPKEFCTGMSFVALSRARSLGDMRVATFNFERLEQISTGRDMADRKTEFQRLSNTTI